MTTKLIITVDTEEEGLWSDSFRAKGNTVENVQGVPALQAVCDNHRLKPVYLINSPVTDDESACKLLNEIRDKDTCEIGCHIHPWNTLPSDEPIDSYQSYLCNLNIDIQKRKLEKVTESIVNKFGARPTSFRSGRYGLDLAGVKLLESLGYIVDSSVCPFTSYADDGGPDFRGYPWTPYYVGKSFRESDPSQDGILEVPVSFGFNWQSFTRAFHFHEALGNAALKKFRMRGILSRLNVLNKIKFSPEKHNAKELITLAQNYAKQDTPCIVMMFHSSSLVPGLSPYVQNDLALRNFLDVIDEVTDFCLNKLNMQPDTLTGFAQNYSSS